MVYNGLWRFLRISHTGNIPVLSHSLHLPSLPIEGCMGAGVQRRGADGESRWKVCLCSEPRLSRGVTWRSCAAAPLTPLFIVFILESLQSQRAFGRGVQLVSCSAWIISAPRAKHWQSKCQGLKYLAHKRRAGICRQTTSLRNVSDLRAIENSSFWRNSGENNNTNKHWLFGNGSTSLEEEKKLLWAFVTFWEKHNLECLGQIHSDNQQSWLADTVSAWVRLDGPLTPDRGEEQSHV